MHLGAVLRHIKMQNDLEFVRSVKCEIFLKMRKPIKTIVPSIAWKTSSFYFTSRLPPFTPLSATVSWNGTNLLYSSALADTAKFLPEQLTLANISYSLGQIHSHTFSVYCLKMHPQRKVLLFFLTLQILFVFAWYTVNTPYWVWKHFLQSLQLHSIFINRDYIHIFSSVHYLITKKKKKKCNYVLSFL